ncbi:electron transport complex subunit RsxC [Paraglaciecola marina]|uniref:electron transport complex subunit RsxC n=1 Tax=Paraglaciecola marina TaxID=2500157 RepID=UPI0010617B89|nr:electron transport complex subunit RsxC [Paraglaciecola marina]
MDNNFDDIVKKLENNELWDFHGGVFPAEQKTLSNQNLIAQLPLSKYLYVPVKQHIGVEGQVIVSEGQAVLKGEPLTQSSNPFAVPIHAPSSGKILSIGEHVSAHPSGLPELTIKIETDQQDRWLPLTPMVDYQKQSKMDVIGAICNAGISGMGGAGFPTHIKIGTTKQVEFLIINGVECEPYITSDDRLMREHAWQIRQGIDVLCHLLNPKCVVIAIEKNKPEAIEAMEVACKENSNYQVVDIPTKYPAGGEKQLIQVLTNREVPAKGLPIDVGVIMHNVGTCFAVSDAIFSGKPLVQRVVTVTGGAVETPGNFWAPIGTPVSHLFNEANYNSKAQKQPQAIMGGPMMGFSITDESVPVVKTTNCILLPDAKESQTRKEQACIRCGACADVCPANLLPQQLFWHAKGKELDKAQDYNLFDCIECGACAYVCPSDIPLVHYYRVAKSEIKLEQDEKVKADKARERFEKRAARLIAEQEARDEKHRLAAEARKQAMSDSGNTAKDKIAAALARAKAKKEATAKGMSNADESIAPHKANENSGTKASSNERVQAAIARAKAKKEAAQKALQQTESKTANLEPTEISDTDSADSKVMLQDADVADTLDNKDKPAIDKKAKVAAAIAKAKAKKLAQQREEKEAENSIGYPDNANSAVEKNTKETQSDDIQAENLALKKQRVAAAVAKAKAKKLAANSDQVIADDVTTKQDTLQSLDKDNKESQGLDQKKQRIAAAVAKAKAKKAAKDASQKTEDDKS